MSAQTQNQQQVATQATIPLQSQEQQVAQGAYGTAPGQVPPRAEGYRPAVIRESRIKDRPYKPMNDSLSIKIELDLEVEVDLYARVKGDVMIGLLWVGVGVYDNHHGRVWARECWEIRDWMFALKGALALILLEVILGRSRSSNGVCICIGSIVTSDFNCKEMISSTVWYVHFL